jgi:hypothetical protein
LVRSSFILMRRPVMALRGPESDPESDDDDASKSAMKDEPRMMSPSDDAFTALERSCREEEEEEASASEARAGTIQSLSVCGRTSGEMGA